MWYCRVEGSIQLLVERGAALEGERALRDGTGLGSEPMGEGRRGQEPGQCTGEGADIVGWDEDAGVLVPNEDFVRRDACGDHGESGGHGLEEGEGHAFRGGGGDVDVGGIEVGSDVVGGAFEADVVEGEFLGEAFEGRALGSIAEDQEVAWPGGRR